MNKLVLFLIGIVLVGIAGFALMWFGVGRELQAAAARTLIDCRDGRFEAVYEEAAPAFREGRSLDELRAYWGEIEARLGTFREILRPLSVSTTEAPDGPSRRVTLEVGFQQGAALAWFDFGTTESEPRLLHFAVQRQVGKPVAADDGEAFEERLLGLMASYNRGAFTAFYADLSPDLQRTWTQRRASAQLATWRGETLGEYVAFDLRETQRPQEDTLVRTYHVQFEKAERALVVTWRLLSESWVLDGFELQ